MRRQCRHESRHGLWWHEGRWVVWTAALRFGLRWEQMAAHRCNDCNAWVGMGPSRDTEQTAIEMRAAELAEAVFDVRRADRTALLSELGFDGAETAGWLECMYDSEKPPEQPGEHAGYLARVIVEHTEEES